MTCLTAFQMLSLVCQLQQTIIREFQFLIGRETDEIHRGVWFDDAGAGHPLVFIRPTLARPARHIAADV